MWQNKQVQCRELYHLPGTVEIGIHLWKAHFSSMPANIKGEHLPTEDGYEAELRSGQDPGGHTDELPGDGFWQLVQKLFDCANPQSWTGVVTHGLQLWGWLDVLPSSLKRHWRHGREMNIQFSGSSSGGHPCSQRVNCTHSQNVRHLWHCVVWQNCTFQSCLLLSPAQGEPV